MILIDCPQCNKELPPMVDGVYDPLGQYIENLYICLDCECTYSAMMEPWVYQQTNDGQASPNYDLNEENNG